MKKLNFLLLFTFLILSACQKDDDDPFGNVNGENPNEMMPPVLDPTSIEGLHQNIFRPTCANSGCHDGTFEPDFRTVESTYNTLVNHPVIKNDPQNSFEFRVVPNNVAASQLVARITYDIDGNSGIMPLTVEPDSDYPAMREEYMQNIRDWIAAGAQNVF